MADRNWVTFTVTNEELELIDGSKRSMEESLGIALSRSAFVRRLLFASVVGVGVIEGPSTENDSKTILNGI